MFRKGELNCLNSLIILWVSLSGCGPISIGTGGAGSVNNSPPNGVLRGQGSFSPLNGQSVSGVAQIYLSTSATTYYLYLVGLSTPEIAGLQVQVTTTSGGQQPAQSLPLIGYSGNQTYTLSIPIGSVVANVAIYNPSATPGTGIYGIAQIISTTTRVTDFR